MSHESLSILLQVCLRVVERQACYVRKGIRVVGVGPLELLLIVVWGTAVMMVCTRARVQVTDLDS